MSTDDPSADRPYLLDTHTFLWMAAEPKRLGAAAREVIDHPATELLLSVASIWEMAIKASLGKLEIEGATETVDAFVRQQLEVTRTRILEVRVEHAVRVETLPWHHRDPFDRLLVAQATFEGLTILGRDPAFDDYDVSRVW